MNVTPALTVLSFGGGQDSTAMLYRLLYDPVARADLAPGRLVVVIADTGDEHPETYHHLRTVKPLCETHGIEFVHITPDMGFHSGNWTSLRNFYRTTTTIGSKSYPKTCTDHLKIRPIYRWMEAYVEREYGITGNLKRWVGRFAERHGKIRVLIGIAKGEEKRVSGKGPVWMVNGIERRYPLIEWGWDRAECQKQIRRYGKPVPIPSNCMLCPFKNEVELVHLYRTSPLDFAVWEQLEAAKLEKWAHKGDKNFGVWGRKTLKEALTVALEKYGSWTMERLEDYRMSHGHCVASVY